MGSRDKDPTTPHQPLLSSVVVRSSNSDGGGAGGGRVGGSDYEPGEVRRDPPPYSRSDRLIDEPARTCACKNLGLEEGILVQCWLFTGYRNRAGSSSPARRRDADNRRHGSDPDRSGGPFRSREFGNGREPRRHRDNSPPYGRVPSGGRPAGRGFDGPGPSRGEGAGRNNPNVQPREGDWFCSDPLCANLNFARREQCNHCRRPRYAPGVSPRRGYPGPPPPHAPPRRFPGPPMDLSPGREMNGFRSSPPRGWARDGPRDFGAAAPPSRHEARFSHHGMHRDRVGYLDDEYRGRNKFDRPMAPIDMGHRDRGRGNDFFNDRKGYERRPLSPPLPPPLPPQRGRWGRERSRSPIRGGLGGPPPPKDYRRDMYLGRGRDDRRGMGRDRIGDAY